MRRQNSGDDGQERYIEPGATIRSIFGPDRERNFDTIRDDSRFKQFRAAIKKIQAIGRAKFVDEGEVLIMINRNFGLVWDTIPFGRMDEITEWVQGNIRQVLAFTCPALHAWLKTNPPYDGKKVQESIRNLENRGIA